MTEGEPQLAGRRILIVEDEYIIAADLEDVLAREGATVVGIASSVAHGLALVDKAHPEAAVLDLNLGGEISAPVASALAERSVPFVIVTGYGESWSRYPEFRDVPRTDKPVDPWHLIGLLSRALAAP